MARDQRPPRSSDNPRRRASAGVALGVIALGAAPGAAAAESPPDVDVLPGDAGSGALPGEDDANLGVPAGGGPPRPQPPPPRGTPPQQPAQPPPPHPAPPPAP